MLPRLARILAWIAIALAALLLIVYAAGRVLTDRLHFSQFIWWMPSLVLLVPATLLAGFLAALTVAVQRVREGLFERWWRRVLAVALVAAWGHQLIIEVRAWRYVLGPQPPMPVAQAAAPSSENQRTTAGGSALLRILQWNAMSPDVVPRADLLPGVLEAWHPDVLLFSAAMAPWQYEEVVRLVPAEYALARVGTLAIVSKLPIRSARQIALGLADPAAELVPPNDLGRLPPQRNETRFYLEYLYNRYAPMVGMQKRAFRNADPGLLVEIEFESPVPGSETFRVWRIDLPSDPLRSKWQLVHAAADAIANAHTTDGSAASGASAHATGVPTRWQAPDVCIGDFNAPRGSLSLRVLTAGLHDAFDDAGRGFSYTWPRVIPALHLDQAYLGPAWEAAAYGTFDPRESDHRALVIDVRAKTKPPR